MGIPDPKKFDTIPDALPDATPASTTPPEGAGYRPTPPVKPAPYVYTPPTPAPLVVETLPIISAGPIDPKEIPLAVLETAPPQVQQQAGYQPRPQVASPAGTDNSWIWAALLIIIGLVGILWYVVTHQ